MWGLLGAILSPLVVYASATLSEGLGGGDASGRGTVDAVSSIITMDFSTYASLFATTAILAPLLEETVFRGFLLTSLTKWMPVPAAVAVSSVAFGMVHLTPRDFPQVTPAMAVLLFWCGGACQPQRQHRVALPVAMPFHLSFHLSPPSFLRPI